MKNKVITGKEFEQYSLNHKIRCKAVHIVADRDEVVAASRSQVADISVFSNSNLKSYKCRKSKVSKINV
jgi:hypothetical protein